MNESRMNGLIRALVMAGRPKAEAEQIAATVTGNDRDRPPQMHNDFERRAAKKPSVAAPEPEPEAPPACFVAGVKKPQPRGIVLEFNQDLRRRPIGWSAEVLNG